MNDKTEDRADDADAADPGDSAGPGAAPALAPEPAEPPVVKTSRSFGVFLTFLLALAAAGGAAWVWLQQQAQGDLGHRVETLSSELDRRSVEIERLAGDLSELDRRDEALGDKVGALDRRIDAELSQVPARISQLEATLKKVPGISQKARSEWLRSEAEYFLRVANAQLSLAGNVGVSLRALELADEQLRDLGDPSLTPVRKAISDERAALRAVPQPDLEGIVLTLGSLERQLDTLPFAEDVPARFGATDSAGGLPDTGWQRAWRAIGDALKSIVSIKRDDEAMTPLLTAADESLLIRSIDVDLQIARLAAIRNEGELYASTLGAVDARLRRYFDTSSPKVNAALTTISELRNEQLPDELPDISGSLTMLLQADTGRADP